MSSSHPRLLTLLTLLLLLIHGTPATLPAQPADTVYAKNDSSRAFYFTANLEKYGKLHLVPHDTTLSAFAVYDPLFRSSPFYATLGNTGHFYRSLTPFDPLPGSGFDYGIHSFDRYLLRADSIRYYRVMKTFSELTYVQGAKKEQNFNVVFSRNIYRSINLGFDFHAMNTPGAYHRQRANHINFDITGQYFTKNRRYGVLANYTFNRLRNYENGGIKYDSLFEENIESNRMVIPVNLETAQNRIRETGVYMKHYVDLTRHAPESGDTTAPHRKRFELGRFTYTFRYDRQTQSFSDNQPDSGFFPAPILDTVTTYDSLTIRKFSNELVWSNPSFRTDGRPRIVELEAGVRQSYSEVALHDVRHFIRQVIPFAAASLNPFPSIRLEGRGDYVLGDYNTNDASVCIRLTSILGKPGRNAGMITVSGDYRRSQPGWFYTHYTGNHYRWDTSWQKQSYLAGGFRYNLRFAEAGVSIARIKNYTYLDTASRPQQFSEEFGYLRLWLNGNLEVWRLKFRTRLQYQTVQGASVLRLPVFQGDLGITYGQYLFKGAAFIEPGFTFRYHTRYFADQYNPSLRMFFLQDRKETGGHLYMDVVVNVKIQRARFFFTYTHFNAGFMGRDYYTTPGYPMQDAAFKFGVSWRFHD